MPYGVDSNFPVGAAAGWCKTVDDVRELARSTASFLVVGSYTVLPRDGNPGNVFNGMSEFSLNSLGMPNLGIEYLKSYGHEMVKLAHVREKPIYLSIAGFSPWEYGILAHVAIEIGFDGVEVNMGCPNVADGGKRKAIASFDPQMVHAILSEIGTSMKETILTVKVSPMTNPQDIVHIAGVISQYPVHAVVSMNTIPNSLDFTSEGKLVIETPDKNGWAGGAGSAILPMALGQVSQWRKVLPDTIQVWGVGGVQNGLAAKKMLLAGASVVQVATGLFVYGPKIFSDIASEFV